MTLIAIYVQWVVQGALDVDIGANPSAEGGGDDEGVDDQAVKVVDIVDTFRLQVFRSITAFFFLFSLSILYINKIEYVNCLLNGNACFFCRSNHRSTRSSLSRG